MTPSLTVNLAVLRILDYLYELLLAANADREILNRIKELADDIDC